MISFKVIEKTYSEIQNDLAESVTCEVSIGDEQKLIIFKRPQPHYLYLISNEAVYVQIPTSTTNRAFFSSDSRHENKVRRVRLYLEKVNGEYHLVENYQVLDGTAYIKSWVNSESGARLEFMEANDLIPRAIFSTVSSDD